ncbi:MAG: flagellar basal body-associated FliL family protein [Candidatus Accumulibacter necessarius]|uniref:flagellar basal body-associated FliL family protein n=1 Tax=Candidatus Accumulibacter necessarius TaxID=2954386 RepID=UPI002FC3AC14
MRRPATSSSCTHAQAAQRPDLAAVEQEGFGSDQQGRQGKLAQEIKEKINSVLDPAGKGKKRDSPVKEVLFTSFIIQ